MAPPSVESSLNGGITVGEEEDGGEQHFAYAMQLVSSGPVPMVLLSLFRLNVFDIISKAGPGAQLSAAQIAAQLESKNPGADAMLDRMLRLLASHSVLTCSVGNEGQRLYGLTPVAKWFLPNPKLNGASLGPLVALNGLKPFGDSWYELEGAIMEGGIPFNRVHGIHAFEYPGRDPTFNDVFNKAMINHTTITMTRILEVYRGFVGLQSLVDIGGGLGMTITMITAKYPNIKGVNFDLPHVIQHAPPYPGVEHIGGDMFESVPKGDAIFLKWILHNWDDEHCVKLLKNCSKSIPEDGKVIVADAVVEIPPPEGADHISATLKANCQLDMIMMAQYVGGKERSQLEFQALATAAGFRGVHLKCVVCNLGIMEFYK